MPNEDADEGATEDGDDSDEVQHKIEDLRRDARKIEENTIAIRQIEEKIKLITDSKS